MEAAVAMLSVVLLMGLIYGSNGRSVGSCEAEGPLEDCGYHGITASQCQDQGCCWKECHGCDSSVPWCFMPTEVIEPGTEGEVRLVGGVSDREGRVEVYHDGQWGTVCDDLFGIMNIVVLCQQLEVTDSKFGEAFHDHALDGASDQQIWLDDVMCTGEEASILDCDHNDWGLYNCDHAEDLKVKCLYLEEVPNPDLILEEGAIQLTGGDGTYGRLEILHNGTWNVACMATVGWYEAAVVCRQLGLTGGYMAERTIEVSPQPIYDVIICDGDEERLADCAPALSCRIPDSSRTLYCGEIEIEDTPGEEGDVRLVTGVPVMPTYMGRVEVYLEGAWGTVCGLNITSEDITYLCSAAGYTGGSVGMEAGMFEGYPGSPIHFGALECPPDSLVAGVPGYDLLNCTFQSPSEDCTHNDDLFVYCYYWAV